jgi:lysophospholipase L1-like esterase
VRTTAARLNPAVLVNRTSAFEVVQHNISSEQGLPIENAAALIPFYERLYRHQAGQWNGPVRILHYGDSHTAADEWTGELRSRLQMRFGDGGPGFTMAGRPFLGYRRLDVKGGQSKNWESAGMVNKPGDGLAGLSGISISTSRRGETVYLETPCTSLEIFYLQQPGGGAMQLSDNGNPVERISTNGELSPGYFRYQASAGPHRFELETLENSPVRLYGWVAENPQGVTYETLGINGAQAYTVFKWDEALHAWNVARRDPALIVLAYGTNEAGRTDQTKESYKQIFSELIQRFRRAAPTASILIVGPPDRWIKSRRTWVPMDNIDAIVEAQREAAVENRCAFWDLRARMGGKGSMRNWVAAGVAQGDHVHFTATGYHFLGAAMFQDMMRDYDTFLKIRNQPAQAAAGTAVH